jgi:hypothetical protein
MTLFDKGVAAIVPVDTTVTPTNPGSYDILSMRVGEILQWYPAHIRVSLYNEQTGRREEITVEKRFAAIVENPALLGDERAELDSSAADAEAESSGCGRRAVQFGQARPDHPAALRDQV